jgi:SAM-dependent methyltransferase
MPNPFATDAMAAGYATARPPVHPRILALAFPQLQRRFPLALDVGCGTGLSTAALNPYADRVIGLEPNQAMLKWAAGAAFVCATAEAIPLRDGAIDLITAAGSLNYVGLDRFFPEAARILAPAGTLLVYDFSPGRDEWFSEFERRYPWPPHEARELDPQILGEIAPPYFRLESHQEFEIGLPLTHDFYEDYVMTETNVAAAIRAGASPEEIRQWCHRTLEPTWRASNREVLFQGYFACLSHSPDLAG